MKFSIYPNGIKNVTPNGEIDIIEFMKLIKSDNSLFKKIREEKDVDKKQELKSKLSYVTFAGIFKRRANKELIKSSGFACLDYDKFEGNLEEVRKKIIENKYTHCLFVSPSGNGLKLIVKIPEVKSNEEYYKYWKSIAEHYGIKETDVGTKDIARACYLSYDAEPYFNKDSVIYTNKVEELDLNIKIEEEGFVGKKLLNKEIFKDLEKLIKDIDLIPYDGSYKHYKIYHVTTQKPDKVSKLKIKKDTWDSSLIDRFNIFSNKLVFVLNNKKHVTIAEGDKEKLKIFISLHKKNLEELFGKELTFDKEEIITKTPPKIKDESRSATEYRKVLSLLRDGKEKEYIFKQMNAYAKWSSAPEQYKELTFNKAQEFLKKYNAEELDSDFEIFTDKDLMEYEPKEQKWLIENQIPQGEIGTLAGKRGERKTFTALYQAACLASQTKTFDNEVPRKGKVLFISEEDGIDTIATRIKGIKKGLGIEEELGIRYLCLNGLKLDRQDLKFQKFKDLLEDFLPDLIIIDALQRCVTFEVDKDNRAISELFTEIIRPLTKKYGMSWLFITHLRKSPTQGSVVDPLDEIRGGSELVNYSRFVLSTQAPKYQTKTEGESELIIFRVLKMSNSRMPQDKVISFTSEGEVIKIKYEGIPEDVLAGEKQSANAIKDWLFSEQLTSFQTKDITKASERIGFKSSMITLGLKLLMNEGFLKKVKRGYYEVVGKSIEEVNGNQETLIPKELSEKELEKLEEEFK